MLDRVYEQKEAIASYGVDHELPHLTYPLMSNVIKVLKPFEEITRVFSSDKEIASSIIPTISTLKLYLGKKGNDFGVGTLKDSLLTSINERFTSGSKGNICLDSSLKYSTYVYFYYCVQWTVILMSARSKQTTFSLMEKTFIVTTYNSMISRVKT